MASEQPYLHNLSGVFSAPIQAWADAHGQVRHAGAQGIYCGDDRVLNLCRAHGGRQGAGMGVHPAAVRQGNRLHLLCPGGRRSSGSAALPGADTHRRIRPRTRRREPPRPLLVAPGAWRSRCASNRPCGEPVTLNVRLTLGADNTTMEHIKQGGPAGSRWNRRDPHGPGGTRTLRWRSQPETEP